MSLLLALLTCWFSSVPALATAIDRVEVKRDRIVVHLDDQVSGATAFVLGGPNRIALDLAGARPGGRSETGGPVTAVRQAARGEDGARLVFDLARPAIVTEGRFGNDGRELTLALRDVDDASFARAAAGPRKSFLPPANTHAAPRRPYALSIAVPKPSNKLKLPAVYGDDDTRPLVVIDAGHGGIDPGAISPTDHLREKDVTLRIARAIRDELVRSGRVRVALTREDDRFLVLQERYGIARKLKASLFISIHCDSVGTGMASGASVYTLSEVASDKESARLAARENKADIIGGIDLGGTSTDISSILIDLTQRETMNSSASFARLLGREAQPLIPMKVNFHRMASLMVLKAPDMPSILFETGYLSNPSDAAFIDSADGRKRIAQSVRRAVEVHFARRLAAAD
ncbi:N-acetylmuramoyl-L-alanine amidase [Sphingomonas sp. PB4P5]|uniref:N-acetylmuramoyl-L-alanine amidase n=1 Tax=Parasphingomonas puruogangriensis TaxID=3096155 RepID=UPI002FC8757E